MFFKLKLFLLFFNLINCKQQQTIDFNIFPTDQLCLICRLIIGYWHNQSGDFNNTEQFKNELQKTCSKLLNETEIEKCKNGINLEKLKELETKSIEKICKLEGFCENEFPIIVNERNQLEHEENVKKYLEIPKIEKIENNKNKTNTKVNETTIKTTTKKSRKNKEKKGFNEEEKKIKFY